MPCCCYETFSSCCFPPVRQIDRHTLSKHQILLVTWKHVFFTHVSAANLDWLLFQLHTLLNHSTIVVFVLNAFLLLQQSSLFLLLFLLTLTSVFPIMKSLYFIYTSYLELGVYFVGFMDIVFDKDWSCVRAVS